MLAFRLKTENSDRSSSDLRLKATELGERYGEAQRELSRLREVVSEQQQQLDLMQAALDSADITAQNFAVEKEALTLRIDSLQVHCTDLEHKHQQQLGQVEASKEVAMRECNEQVAQLQAELASVSSRLLTENDSAGNLDNYKKRAQLALKKVCLCSF